MTPEPEPEMPTPTPETAEPVMAALRRQRPVELADVEYGGPVSEPEANLPEANLPEANDPDRIKRQVATAGQAYKQQKPQQQQQQQQQDTKDRYIVALEKALTYFEASNGKLTDQVLAQTQLIEKNLASNAATLLRRLEGLETNVALLKVPESQTEPETETPAPEPVLSKCLEHMLNEASHVTLVEVDKAIQRAANQVLGRLDRLEVIFNATRDNVAAFFKTAQDQNMAGLNRLEGGQNKMVAAAGSLEKSCHTGFIHLEKKADAGFFQLEKNANASFIHLETNTNASFLHWEGKVNASLVHLEKNSNASRDQLSLRLDQMETDKKKMAADMHQRFEQQDRVLNQTHTITANTSARLNECIRAALEEDHVPLEPIYGQLWTYLRNLYHDSVPADSNLWHPQSLFDLALSPSIWFGPLMALLSHFCDSRLSSRVADCLGVRRPWFSKAS